MLNDHEIETALASIHQGRTHLAEPAALRQRLAEIPTTTKKRGFLPPLTGRFQSMFSATKFVVAGAILALFGGFLLVAQPLDPGAVTVPGATSTTSALASGDDCHPLEEMEGRELVPGCTYFTGFGSITVPTPGWEHRWEYPGYRQARGMTLTKEGAEVTLVIDTPDGTYADPCSQERGEPIYVRGDDGQAILQHSADLVAAMAAIPGIEVVDGPSSVVGAPPGWQDIWNHLVIRVPEDACLPFGLWWDSDLGARWLDRAGETIRIWIYNHPYITSSPAHPTGTVPAEPFRIWIEAGTRADANQELDREIEQIIGSIETPG